MFVVGIDGGGTKTSAKLYSLDKTLLEEQFFGPLNLNSQSLETLEKTLHEIANFILQFNPDPNVCQQIIIGVAGISNPQVPIIFYRIFTIYHLETQLHLLGDHQIALFGALESPIGIGLVSGTGSICFGTNAKGQEHRTGGWGHLIGDEGSGYSIGIAILQAVVKSFDHRLPATILTSLVFNFLQIHSIPELIAFTYQLPQDKSRIAALAPLLDIAVAQADPIALDIAQSETNDLYCLIETVYQKLEFNQSSLVLMGSILTKSPIIPKFLQQKIQESNLSLSICLPKHDPATGAALLALDRLKNPAFYSKL